MHSGCFGFVATSGFTKNLNTNWTLKKIQFKIYKLIKITLLFLTKICFCKKIKLPGLIVCVFSLAFSSISSKIIIGGGLLLVATEFESVSSWLYGKTFAILLVRRNEKKFPGINKLINKLISITWNEQKKQNANRT